MYQPSGSSHHHGYMRIQYLNYVRNSRAIAVIWGIFTICFAILNIVAFIQPQWIGDTEESPQVGYFGLFSHCIRNGPASTYECKGEFTDFSTILSGSFQAAAFFVGFSALLFLICIACFLLFFILNTATVLQICGWMQAISALSMFLGCVIYPNGWDNNTVKSVCGYSVTSSYNRGTCGLRWAFILSIILIFDAIILALLAFLLAYKQMKLLPEVYEKGDHSKSELNGYSDTYASKSHTMDRFSEYSTHRSERSKHSQSHSHRY